LCLKSASPEQTMVNVAFITDPASSRSGAGPVAADLGRSLVESIVHGDFVRLEGLLAPDVRFRALVPRAYREASAASEARALIEGWFGDTADRQLLGSAVEAVSDRLVIRYRIALTKAGERRIVEQDIAAIVDGGRFSDVALVCSGFRPLPTDRADESGQLEGAGGRRAAHATGGADGAGDRASPGLATVAHLDAIGLSCATLTPAIRAAVVDLEPGAILEIETDDHEAEEGLRSWTRLTGHDLLEMGPQFGPTQRFRIRRALRAGSTKHRGTV
jgi:TusA-related sulfurtransferase